MRLTKLISIGTFSLLLLVQHSYAQISNCKDLISKMMNQKEEGWFESYTFIQRTVKYDNEGKVKGEEYWYEAIKYPNQFRIDYGDPSNGNATIYRNDSSYVFRAKSLERIEKEYQEFLLMEGGLHHMSSTTEVIRRLKEFGYNLSKFYSTIYNNRKVYVFGADASDMKSKQMWIDAEHFYIVRKFEPFREKYTLESRYDDFKKYGPQWIENKVSFYIDGNLIQDEYYENIDITAELDDRLFDPKKAFQWHWYSK